ncbi:MAG: cation:proton antiporter [Alphaproteobacteria bacterium]|nr:cation:proton antiporter [Alphaproteobacteria bacterium]
MLQAFWVKAGHDCLFFCLRHIMNDTELLRFLLATVALLGSAHFTGYLFQRFGLPRVVGEICGGIVLGKTGLGYALPDIHAWLFDGFDAEPKLLAAFYWLGLILLMFTSGFTMESGRARTNLRLVVILVIGSTSLPFLAGWLATTSVDFSPYQGSANNAAALSLVVAIAVAVTSIPVISRIFLDLGIATTSFARNVLATAVAHDIILWGVLAVATSLVSAGSTDGWAIVFTIVKTVVFFSLSIWIGPRLLDYLTRSRYNLVRKGSPIGWVLIICFLLAALASILNVNVIFGALIAGLLFGLARHPDIETVRSRISDFSFAFFVPFYFAMVGMKLDLIAEFDPLFTLAFILFCTACQMLATVASAKLARRGWAEAFDLGVAMNARGGPGIVLATVALEFGIINGVFYTTLILLAILTSLAAGSWFRRQLVCNRPPHLY